MTRGASRNSPPTPTTPQQEKRVKTSNSPLRSVGQGSTQTTQSSPAVSDTSRRSLPTQSPTGTGQDSRRSSVVSSSSGSSATTFRSTRAKHHGIKILDVEGIKALLGKRVTNIAINFKIVNDQDYLNHPLNTKKKPLLHWSYSVTFMNGNREEAVQMQSLSPSRDYSSDNSKGQVNIRHVGYVIHRDVLPYQDLQFVRRVTDPNATVKTFIDLIMTYGLYSFRPDKNGFGCLSWVRKLNNLGSHKVEGDPVREFDRIINIIKTKYVDSFWVPNGQITWRPIPEEDEDEE